MRTTCPFSFTLLIAACVYASSAAAALPSLPRPAAPLTQAQRDADVKAMREWWFGCKQVPDIQVIARLKAWTDAKDGDGEALFYLWAGYRFNLVGSVVDTSDISPFDLADLIRKAAALKFTPAQSRQAIILLGPPSLEFSGPLRDPDLGLKLLKECVAKNDPDALLYMGTLLASGEGGLNADYEAAEVYFRKAIELGTVRGWGGLAKLQARLDEEGAEETLKAGAEAGDPDAQLLLAKRCKRFAVTWEERGEAFDWLKSAAEGQTVFPEAALLLADMYYNGEAGEADHAWALYWYKRAGALGHLRGEFQAATQMLKGDGCELDIKTGLDKLRKLAGGSYGPAKTQLGVIYLEGLLLPRDVDRAMALFADAVKNGDLEAYNRYWWFARNKARDAGKVTARTTGPDK